MFERFTREARAVVQGAQVYARTLDHERIGSQHLLLAALDDAQIVALLAPWELNSAVVRGAVAAGPADLDAEALAGVGVDLASVQARVEGAFGAGALRRRPSRRGRRAPAFSPGAKASLELALHEALELEDHFIGVEHVLLGVLAERAGLGARILADHGVDLPALRDAVLDARGR